AEMAMASGIGAKIAGLLDTNLVPVCFGEDQGRYLVTVSLDPQGEDMAGLWNEAESLGIRAVWIGSTQGDALQLHEDLTPIPLADLKAAHEGWFPQFMAGGGAD